VPAGAEVLRWLPPLNVNKNEVEEAIKIMKVTLSDKII
jgi:acetylornithine/succinyldiaminopimelate/putrescine aminotransferase